LIEFYLYPPKYPNPAAIAALALPRHTPEADIHGVPAAGAIGDRMATGNLETI
jgi:hypothetical protein